MSISKKLKQLRDKQNWSQEFVAKLMNVHRSTISKYETGQIVPTYRVLLKFADIYQVDRAFLIDQLDESHGTQHKTRSNSYVLKEGTIDPEMDMIKQLLHSYPELKKSLLELYNFDEKTKAQTVRVVQFLIQGMKKG
ncbi:helix-turn-helix domain-containing protein [Bacillus sp. FJAT-29937]|uniref:helix-turn-helix domain-containing protein n=1 Tax=Bacillus sp. FJAT-29937 TaxID=1720553 RepID=UPI00082F139C|nr:helix-turn-helix transcriptional regulator [Bacillus sp. FJAT-29937]